MAFIPKDARWYVADLVQEFTIDRDDTNVVHINTHLIEAGSPEQAYQKANDLGRDGEHEYTNTDGERVCVTFRGLQDLNVVHEALEDGVELFYDEMVGLSEDEVRQRVKPREELAVFSPRHRRRELPNYLSQEVVDLMRQAGWSGEDADRDDD
jgi:Domain of unknown function (DUF4288)